ncbi:ras GTPase-activating-like protein IQGAP3 isoform X2 [Stigmatopora argus]
MLESPAPSQYGRLTAEQMDEQRLQNVAYHYLCRLEEAKRWMEACLGEELPPPGELEETLRNGVVLAKVAHRFAPAVVPREKIYDLEQRRYQAGGLEFRHTDNINRWRGAMAALGLPPIFHPETTDVYEKKNMPRAVYCIHALGVYLSGLGLAPPMAELCGEVKFSEEEIHNMKLELDKCGLRLPAFHKIQGILSQEMSTDEAADAADRDAADRDAADRDAAEARAAAEAVNESLRGDDPGLTLERLRAPPLRLPPVFTGGASLYHRQLGLLQTRSAQGALHQEELFVAVEMLSAVVLVNQALEAGDPRQLGRVLASSSAGLTEVDPALLDEYLSHLSELTLSAGCQMLTWNQLQEGIWQVNEKGRAQDRQILALRALNEALTLGDPDGLLSALMSLPPPSGGAVDIRPADVGRYLSAMRDVRRRKAQVGGDAGAELWLADVQEVVTRVNRETGQALKSCLALAAVNQAVKEKQAAQTLRVLSLPEVALQGVRRRDAAEYQLRLASLMRRKAAAGNNKSPWVGIPTADGAVFFFHLGKLEGTWQKPPHFVHNSVFLDRRDVQEAVSDVRAEQRRRELWADNVELIARLQAASRGFLARRRLAARRRYLRDNVGAIVLIQAHWRRFVCQRAYRRRLRFLYSNWRAAVKVRFTGVRRLGRPIRRKFARRGFGEEGVDSRASGVSTTRSMTTRQSGREEGPRSRGPSTFVPSSPCFQIQGFVKMWLARRKYLARLSFFAQNVGAIVKIQTFFRTRRAQAEYRALAQSDAPPLSVLGKFVHLLDFGNGDMREEAELARLRGEVVRAVRSNRRLEADLDLMDLKIGLLVRNRATLQEVAAHCKKLTKKNKEKLSGMMDAERSKGLKALSREHRQRLEAYQHLFYLLQTRPSYLAKLLFLASHSGGSSSLVQMLIFSLFNYGADDRQAFLLVRLFTEALHLELRSRVSEPRDVIKGNPLVVKMLVDFYRRDRGRDVLREVLGPALADVLAASETDVRTDPLEVYKSWINQSESRSGQKSSLPYEVSAEEALAHPEVRRRVDVAAVNLQNLTQRILQAITSSVDKLPYGFRHMAKVLGDALRSEFPAAGEDDVYKVLCNVLYYRFINPAVVAPDAFDACELPGAPGGLRPERRRLLGSAARLLQRAAAGERFLGDGRHVAALNRYVECAHGTFRKWVSRVIDVPEPSRRYGLDEYSETLIVGRPVVYLSLGELLDAHRLLLEHRDVLCPEAADPLAVLLADVGPVPTRSQLTGVADGQDDPASDWRKTEISLTLADKFEDRRNGGDDDGDLALLFLRTKRLIADVIRAQPGDTLADVLRTAATPEQEACHRRLMRQRAVGDAPARPPRRTSSSFSALDLEEKKRKIGKSVRRLEAAGLLPPTGAHRRLLAAIAQDVRNRCARRRRRAAELAKLDQTLGGLRAKSDFLGRQADYYRHYIARCLDELTAAAGTAPGEKRADARGKRKLTTVSYTAARLHQKGVLLEIGDLPSTQFKNVQFDIASGAEKGSFLIRARFLGVDVEEFHIKYQDLLQLQYDGVALMKMFDKAKVNVNLLIFLLNKKFFNK